MKRMLLETLKKSTNIGIAIDNIMPNISGGSRIFQGGISSKRRGHTNLLFDQIFQKLHENICTFSALKQNKKIQCQIQFQISFVQPMMQYSEE